MYSSLNSLKVLPDSHVHFDVNGTLFHFQPVKVSLGVPLQGLSLNIIIIIIIIFIIIIILILIIIISDYSCCGVLLVRCIGIDRILYWLFYSG